MILTVQQFLVILVCSILMRILRISLKKILLSDKILINKTKEV